MKLIKNCLIFFLVPFCLFADQSTFLKNRLSRANLGDYIVTEQNQMIVLLSVRALDQHKITLEEISAPKSALYPKPSSWKEWIEQVAPGHTSWVQYEIDLENREILEAYSFSRSAFLQLSSSDSILSTLLHLPLQPVAYHERKRIGPAPIGGEMDHRKFWNPPKIVEGLEESHPHFSVFKTFWPSDGTDLAGKKIELYFDTSFPFPYWIQISNAAASVMVRVIDSGSKLHSPMRDLPRRYPEILGSPQLVEKKLRFVLRAPKYYKDFSLYAVDHTNRQKKELHPLECQKHHAKDDLYFIDVKEEILMQTLQKNHTYTFMLSPNGYRDIHVETQNPFLLEILNPTQ